MKKGSTVVASRDTSRAARVLKRAMMVGLNAAGVDVADLETAQVGDWVEAIGSPFALPQTVTAGIISAKNRTIDQGAPGQFQHFIQTDAAINPGNSGGPLLEHERRSDRREHRHLHAIGRLPGNRLRHAVEYGGCGLQRPDRSPSHKVTRGSIGIQFREGLSGAVNRVYGFKNGVLVQEVQPGGPADKAGLKAGDIITTIDGREIKDGDDLVNEIAGRRPGSTIRLGYMRDGKPMDTTVTIGDRDKVFAESEQSAA